VEREKSIYCTKPCTCRLDWGLQDQQTQAGNICSSIELGKG
jgi:hypothetical protein